MSKFIVYKFCFPPNCWTQFHYALYSYLAFRFLLVSNNMLLVSFWALMGSIFKVKISANGWRQFWLFPLCSLTFFQLLLTAQFQSHFHIFRVCYSSTLLLIPISVLVFYCCHNKLLGTQWHKFITSQFCRLKVQHGSHWAGLCSFLEVLGRDPFPCSFRLLAEFASLWLGDGGPCKLRAGLVP